ncbi:MAG: AAA family ATPase, partial [Candidatus Dormibacteria bacterium]
MVLARATTEGDAARRLSSAATLVGREGELEVLTRTSAQPPAVIFIEGEAGVGKSRLISEFRASGAAPAPVLIGHCHSQRHPFPLQPLVEALHRAEDLLRYRKLGPVAGALRPLLPELAELLPPAPPPTGDTKAEGHQLFRAIREVLAAMGPLVVVLEELHWADETTAELLHFLLSDPPPRLTLILTHRPEDLAESSSLRALAGRAIAGVESARICLSPLGPGDVAHLVAAILGVDRVSDEFADLLHERTSGVPFAVEEVLRLLEDRRDLVHQDGHWTRRALERIALPTAVRDAILERLARLGPHARQVAWAAAVLGVPATEEELATIHGGTRRQIAGALTEVLHSGLLHETADGRVEFHHDLGRQAVYEAIPGPQRRRLHQRVAAQLERDPGCPAARVAHHYREAGRMEDWVRHAERAASQAVALFEAPDSCRILLDLQATASLSLPVRARLATKLGHEPQLALSRSGAVDMVRRILDEEPPGTNRGELRLLLGRALLDAGEWALGREEMVQAVPELEGNPGLQGRALMTLSDPRLPEGTVEEHRAWLDRLASAAGGVPEGPARLAVELHRAVVLTVLGDPEGRPAVARLPTPGNSVGERRSASAGLAGLAVADSFLAHYDRARELVAEATTLVDEFDCGHVLAGYRAIELMLDWWTGRWTDLEARAEVITGELLSIPRPRPEVVAVNLFRLARQGPEAAEQGLRSAMQEAWRAGSLPGITLAAGGVTRCRLATGDVEGALASGERAMALLRRKGVWVWATEAVAPTVEALARAGRVDEAATTVEELAAGISGRDAPAAAAALLVCRGIVAEARGDAEIGAGHFQAASEAWAELPRPYDAGLCMERGGRAVLDVDSSRAYTMLRLALATLDEV